ncbi:MAG: tRNA lysidine(34) synthetase TilS, partial [Pseudomonadota bacterium]
MGVAVSGGSDSLALLHYASDWAKRSNRELAVFSVDHQLRAEAANECAFVAEIATELGWPHRTLIWERSHGAQSQSRARAARHGLLAEAVREIGGALYLTGHTADDQVETFLLRARAGSGPIGLAAARWRAPCPVWPAGRRVSVGRPLLSQKRSELQATLIKS